MPNSRLELISSYGDQTIAGVRFVLHGSSNATESASIMNEGLRFIEGRPTVSTNIMHAHDWTTNRAKQAQSKGLGTVDGEPGSVFVFAVPQNYFLGYGVFTTAYIDRTFRRVSGAPLRFASARKQLALYSRPDTEVERMHIESEVANGYALDQRSVSFVEPKYLVGSFENGPALENVIAQLDVGIRSLEALDYERLEQAMQEVFRPAMPANSVLVPSVVQDIIVGTVESMIISRLRMMRWQGLGTLGYTFYEGKQAIEAPRVASVEEQRQRMDEFSRVLVGSGLFAAQLAWLKIYAAHQLELMRVELEGAKLQGLSD